MTERIAIGIGCTTQATSEDMIALIKNCITDFHPGSLLATLDRRADIAGIVADQLGLKLMLFSASQLAQTTGTTIHSPRAMEEVGTGSVAEAAALTALGPAARLLIARRTGNRCTCAIAMLP